MEDFMIYEQMEFSKIKKLQVGDNIHIGIIDAPKKMKFIESIVTRPLFWNSDADEPDWEVETNNGFVDIYSIYQTYNSENDLLEDLMMEQKEQM